MNVILFDKRNKKININAIKINVFVILFRMYVYINISIYVVEKNGVIFVRINLMF